MTYSEREEERTKPYTIEDIRYAELPTFRKEMVTRLANDLKDKKGYVRLSQNLTN